MNQPNSADNVRRPGDFESVRELGRGGRSVDSVRKLWTRALVQLRRALGDVP